MLVTVYTLTSGLLATVLFVASLNGIRLPERALRVLLIALVILIVGSFALVLCSAISELAAMSGGGLGVQSALGASSFL